MSRGFKNIQQWPVVESNQELLWSGQTVLFSVHSQIWRRIFNKRAQFCGEKKAEPSCYMLGGIFKVEAQNGLKSLHAALEVCSGSLITHSWGKESRELITRTQPQLEPPHWHKVNPHDAAGSAFKEMINSSSKGLAFVLLNAGVEIRKVLFSFKTFRATPNWPLCCSLSARICVITV